MDISASVFVARLLGLPIVFAIDPFAPLVVFGIGRRLGLIQDPYLLQPAFAGFSSGPFLCIILVLYGAHILGDKVPPIAHALDAVYLVLKPLASALVGFWMADTLDTERSLHLVTLAVVILGSVAVTGVVHVAQSTVRVAASVGTFGFAVPFISALENALGILLSVLILVRPEIALLLFTAFGIPFALLCYAIVKRLRRTVRAVRSLGRKRREPPLARTFEGYKTRSR